MIHHIVQVTLKEFEEWTWIQILPILLGFLSPRFTRKHPLHLLNHMLECIDMVMASGKPHIHKAKM